MRAALLVALVAGCGSLPSYVCATNDDCGGAICTRDQRCAVTDSDCSSGLRYDDSAGPLADRCVPDAPDGPHPLLDFQMFDIAAAVDDYAPSCAPAGGRDAMFQTTVSEVGRLYIDTYGSDFRAVVAVHRGPCDARTTELACGSASCDARLHQWTGIVEPGVYCVIADRYDDAEPGTMLALRTFTGDAVDVGQLGNNTGDTCDDDLWEGTCTGDVESPDWTWFFMSCVPTTLVASTCTSDPQFDGNLMTFTLSWIERQCTDTCTAQIVLDEPGAAWIVAEAPDEPSCGAVTVNLSVR